MIIKNALVYTLDSGFIKKDILIHNGLFTDTSDFSDSNEDILDAGTDYLIPGLVDIHFHGCMGADFSDGTPESLSTIGTYEAKNGITSICPASMTLSKDILLSVCKNAYAYRQNRALHTQARLCGIHLEGPFISHEKKGAQNPAFIRNPDITMFQQLQDASNNLVKLITLAPETDGAFDFIEELHTQVHISLGHTCSDYTTAQKAFLLGADHVTHFYNAMPGFTHRAPGLIGAAFDCSHVMPELICDGIHIDPAAVRMTLALFGKERLIFISDSMRAAGMPNGTYSLGGLPVNVKGSLATLEDGTIAGSATNLMDCMRFAVSMGIPLETAVRCATYNPAKSIGMEHLCGQIAPNTFGDCVLLSQKDLSTQGVILGGELIK